jgi:hypothetical protein
MLAQSLKQTVGVCQIAVRLSVIVLTFSLFGSARGAGYVMQLQTTGSSFSPAAYLDGVPQTFVWNWSDGTTSNTYPVVTKSLTSGSRTQYLTIDPISALTNFNIGYDASDSGDTNNYTMRPTQKVRSVYFLQPLTNLQYWASSYDSITNTMDFRGFTQLRDAELWHCTNLQHVIITNLPFLRRACVEACTLRELDISGLPNFEEIRGALNQYSNIVCGGGTGPLVWHFCVRDNPQITQDFQTILTNFYSLREPWFWNCNQSGALKFVSTNLTDVEVFNNHYYSADFTGQSNMVELQIMGNVLTNLVIAGCTALQDFEANDNQLPTPVIDTLLTFLDTSCSNINYINLGNNSPPSGVGYAHYVSLTNQGINIVIDLPSSFAPVVSFDSMALLAENCFPYNGSVDPGETVTISFAFNNTGIRSTTNLTATLLATNGVTLPSGPQNYGAIAGGGPSVARSFTFKASGTCGGTITANLKLQDGATSYGTFSVPIMLGAPAAVFAENFDAAVAPALPVGWSSSASNAQSAWSTVTDIYDSAPNAAFSPDATNVGINELDSPLITLPVAVNQLSFANAYDLEADASNGALGYDGGVLEIKIGNGAFTDILTAGGSFAANGYNRTISSSFGSPISGRQAWSGSSGGFVQTVVNLPTAAAGQTVQFRWRCASDNSTAKTGWRIDSILVTAQNCCDPNAPLPAPVMQGLSVVNGSAVLNLYGAPGKTYRLQYKTNLDDPNWIDLPPDFTSTNAAISITNLVGDSPQRFYRIYRLP